MAEDNQLLELLENIINNGFNLVDVAPENIPILQVEIDPIEPEEGVRIVTLLERSDNNRLNMCFGA
jgi:hypothetical protein